MLVGSEGLARVSRFCSLIAFIERLMPDLISTHIINQTEAEIVEFSLNWQKVISKVPSSSKQTTNDNTHTVDNPHVVGTYSQRMAILVTGCRFRVGAANSIDSLPQSLERQKGAWYVESQLVYRCCAFVMVFLHRTLSMDRGTGRGTENRARTANP